MINRKLNSVSIKEKLKISGKGEKYSTNNSDKIHPVLKTKNKKQ